MKGGTHAHLLIVCLLLSSSVALAAGKHKRVGTSPKNEEEPSESESAGAATDREEVTSPEDSADATPVKKSPRNKRFRMETSEKIVEPAARSAPPWLDAELGGGVLDRNLSYHQDISSTPLLPYYLPAGPILVFSAVAYPHGSSEGGAVSNFGFEAKLLQGIVFSRLQVSGGEAQFSNTIHDFAGGVRYRVPLSSADDIFISATYGEDAFTFSGPNRGNLLIPDTIYRYLRPGVGAHLDLGGGVSIRAAFGYRAITNAGGPQISKDFFPRLAVSGIDGEVAGGYAISNLCAIYLGVEWRRYWYSMNSRPGDMFIAGGAVDQSFAFTAAIALTLGGIRGASLAEAPPSAEAHRHPPPPDDETDSTNGDE